MARTYRLSGVAPSPYTESTRSRIVAHAERSAEPWDYAWTSGTTSEPKQIFYPATRLRSLANHFVDQVVLATDAHAIAAPRIHFLNSLTADRSVSALMASSDPPSVLAEELLGDYFALRQAAVNLTNRYDNCALCWSLIWSLRPTVLTMANSSSLCMLLRKGCEGWTTLREQVRAILGEPVWGNAIAARGGALLGTRDEVLAWLAATPTAPAPADLLPELEMIYCWLGGYVRPFVEQLRESLRPLEPRFAPMFSLATEFVASSNYPHLARHGGLPAYPGCCYEFLAIDAAATTENLLAPWELVADSDYRMVVSDAFGLVRYDTQDVFRCVGLVGDAPLIDFQRRHGLAYSFTGEKLTDIQLQQAYAEVIEANHLVGRALTCFPRRGAEGLPGYRFVLVAPEGQVDSVRMARHLDEALRRINLEYDSKRATDRLAPPDLITMASDVLTAMLVEAVPRTAAADPGQFKLLPLYTIVWEQISQVSPRNT